MTLDEKKSTAAAWFRQLRDDICAEFEAIEGEYATHNATHAVVPPPFGGRLGGGLMECELHNQPPLALPAMPPPHPSPDGGGGDSPTFTRTPWQREGGGSGEISIMKGRVFEKVGVNISVVQGEFSEQFRHEIPGASENPTFWAAGISLVAHMASPLVPAAHMNTRMIVVGEDIDVSLRSGDGRREPERSERGGAVAGASSPPALKAPKRIWFGGGGDLNPMIENPADTEAFHAAFKETCDALDEVSRANAAMSQQIGAEQSNETSRASEPSASIAARSVGQQTNAEQLNYYDAFKQWCDEYFFIPHRGEARGVGGIFYDYLGLNRFGADTSPATSGRFGKGGVTGAATAHGMQRAANADLDWNQGFAFTQQVGRTFAAIYPTLIRRHMFETWTDEQRHQQLVKRGRYAEYNLLYDRGTRFGLMTGGNPEAILMSLPPLAIWE